MSCYSGSSSSNRYNNYEKYLEEEVSRLRSESYHSSDCFIATAAKGTPFEGEVCCLRNYRDIILRKSLLGRLFIWSYYRLSPPIASLVSNNKTLKNIVLKQLHQYVPKLKEKYKLYTEPCDITIQYTTGCNLSCKLCSANPTKVNNKISLVKDELLIFLEKYNQLIPLEWIIWIGKGEIFVENEFINSLNSVCERYPDIKHTIITNGMYPELLKQIKYPSKINLSVSLDGIKEIHEFNRGKGTHDKVIEFIKTAKELDFNIACRAIATRPCIETLDIFLKELQQISNNISLGMQILTDPYSDLNVKELYISRKELLKVCQKYKNVFMLPCDIMPTVTIQPTGIYNCEVPLVRLGDFNSSIEDILESYLNTYLRCDVCMNKKCR